MSWCSIVRLRSFSGASSGHHIVLDTGLCRVGHDRRSYIHGWKYYRSSWEWRVKEVACQGWCTKQHMFHGCIEAEAKALRVPHLLQIDISVLA